MILIVSKIQTSDRNRHVRCSDLLAFYERVHKNETVAEAADALRYLVEGRPFGRVVLTI